MSFSELILSCVSKIHCLNESPALSALFERMNYHTCMNGLHDITLYDLSSMNNLVFRRLFIRSFTSLIVIGGITRLGSCLAYASSNLIPLFIDLIVEN